MSGASGLLPGWNHSAGVRYRTRATGSGLGLAVAQKVAAAHEGRLFLAAPDAGFRGAHFVLELPRRGRDGGADDGA